MSYLNDISVGKGQTIGLGLMWHLKNNTFGSRTTLESNYLEGSESYKVYTIDEGMYRKFDMPTSSGLPEKTRNVASRDFALHNADFFGVSFKDKPISKSKSGGYEMSYLIYDETAGNEINNFGSYGSRNNEYHTGVDSFLKSFDPESGGFKPGRSIIEKTQYLFKRGEINSMISRFFVKDGDDDVSRGRKLDAKYTGDIHGYENPYCRVWTSHHQYHKIRNLMTPQRYNRDTAGMAYTLEELHKKMGEDFRPNRAPSRLSKFTARNALGITKIAPKKVDEVKKCMFSIENLAWKDINFNALVDGSHKTITNEQTGPNGGRIMWFPPYNIKFSENVRTKWDTSEFIGRGENIYTYVNTERTGRLDFTILVDHTARISKWSGMFKDKDSPEKKDIDTLLRYLAGIDVPEIPGTSAKKKEPVTQKLADPSNDPRPSTASKPIMYFVIFFPNNYTGKYDDIGSFYGKLRSGYKEEGKGPIVGYETTDSGIDTSEYTSDIPVSKERPNSIWKYWIDYNRNGANPYPRNYYEEILAPKNYSDSAGYQLNSNPSASSNIDDIISQLMPGEADNIKISDNSVHLGGIKELADFVKENFDLNLSYEILGSASSPGKKNKTLSMDRALKIKELITKLGVDEKRIISLRTVVQSSTKDTNSNETGVADVSSKKQKIGRSVVVKVYDDDTSTQATFTGGTTTVMTNNVKQIRNDQPRNDSEYTDPSTVSERAMRNMATISTETTKQQADGFDDDSYTYDNEYLYFNEIYEDNDIVKRNIVEKVKYFHPAFHSITPEGFNARLTFLQQCMRQGPTFSASDSNGDPSWAGNLSFGRAPYCILRIGDFFNTKICIDNLDINYESEGGVTWDLNQDGIGIQPMLANVSISFRFIGGQDLSGPIARLQNAVSYNYYANTSVYDRHSDYRDDYISPEVSSENSRMNGDAAWIWEPTMNKDENNKDHRIWGTTNGYHGPDDKYSKYISDYTYTVGNQKYKNGYAKNVIENRNAIRDQRLDMYKKTAAGIETPNNLKTEKESVPQTIKHLDESFREGVAINLIAQNLPDDQKYWE